MHRLSFHSQMNRKRELSMAKRVSLEAVPLGKKLCLQDLDGSKKPVMNLKIDERRPDDKLLSVVEEEVSNMIGNLFSFVSVTLRSSQKMKMKKGNSSKFI